MIPGSNLLNKALTVISSSEFQYLSFLRRNTNDIGLDVPVYASPIQARGSVQAVPRELFQQYGLEFQRNYLMFYVSAALLDIKRDVSGDHIIFKGSKFQCVSKTDWFKVDGWIGIIAVEIPA